MKQLVATALVALAVTGCATAPERIEPLPNPAPCLEQDRARLAKITRKQRATAEADTIAVLMVGMPLGSFLREDHETEIAILRGVCGQ